MTCKGEGQREITYKKTKPDRFDRKTTETTRKHLLSEREMYRLKIIEKHTRLALATCVTPLCLYRSTVHLIF